ncbi:P-type ATPase-like protein [Powellomyces hirtus]|nr:P-type ATPase-like protein [Powellomyces hirtus]
MRPIPDRRHSRSGSVRENDESILTPSRDNEFPPDPDTLLYGSFATSSIDLLNGRAQSPVDDDRAVPDEKEDEIHAIVEVDEEDEEEEEEEDDEEEEIVKGGKKAAASMLRGKAASRLPQRAAAMASRTARADTPLRAGRAVDGYAVLSGQDIDEPEPTSLHDQEYEVDEDVRIMISGYRWSRFGKVVYKILCIITGGIMWLLCRWIPRWELALTTTKCSLYDAEIVAVTNQYGEVEVVPVSRDVFEGTVADVFQRSGVSKGGHATDGSVDLRDRPLSRLITFEYRYMRFIFNPVLGQFDQNSYWRDHRWTSVDKVAGGLTDDETVKQRKKIFGDNAVVIAEKPVFRLLMDEVLNPFYVFQVASIILWCLDDYYYYAVCIGIISTTSAVATLLETRETMRRMRELSRFSCDVRVFRHGHWRTMLSDDIVPGDVYEVTPGMLQVFPCDGVLLYGDCIVNESMLTGESVPVSKTPIKDVELRTMDIWEEDPASSSRMSKFFLFAGTKIIRVRAGGARSGTNTPNGSDSYLPTTEPGALALAVRTGFNTTKGSLVRSMMFPKPNTFKFYRDSFRFIGVMAGIAGLGFLGSLYNFVLLGVAPALIIIRALDLITIVVPPALPATMAIGTSFAIGRLRKGDIYCTSPPRVNMCGKLDLIAFDKTGTLTEEGLDVLGFRFTVPSTVVGDSLFSVEPALDGALRFSALYRSVADVIPKGALNNMAEEPDDDGFNRSMPEFSRALSGMSVSLGVTAGHPNGSEPDFPYPLIVCAMATCHSIKVVNDELMGDPMDLKMFEFTGWHIEEGGHVKGLKPENGTAERPASAGKKGSVDVKPSVVVRPPDDVEYERAAWGGGQKPERKYFTELEVIRSFEFLSNLRRMSVIIRRSRYRHEPTASAPYPATLVGEPVSKLPGERQFEVFVKGAPEIMRSICTPESLPPDYDQQLNDYAHHGYRVIACAWRRFDGLSSVKVMRMKRDAVEKDLQFLGFIVFENKLKPGTAPVVNALRRARVREVMCTGDNVLTAISVSRECGLVDPSHRTFVPHFLPGVSSSSEDAQLVWEDVEGTGAMLDSETLLPKISPSAAPAPSPPPGDASFNTSHQLLQPVSFPSYDEMDGASSTRSYSEEFITDMNSPVARVGEYHLAVTGDVFQWMLEFASDDSFNRMLVKGQIYARMSPDQKHFLVENFQELGYCVGFCGDGANDCGALKAADVGLSLSEAEASVAAPFTSRSTDLDCILRVIREGRAALVTSFSCFKYMALYSLIQFTSVSLLYSLAGNLGDFQFLFIDLALIIPIAVFMGRSGAHTKIYRKRPTASLVSRKVLTSLICQVIIQAGFQFYIFMWIRRQPFYEKSKGHIDDRMYKSYENTAVFLLSCFQYIGVAVAFCVGPPYRESMWRNTPFLTTVISLFAFVTFITLAPTPYFLEMLDLVNVPFAARLVIFLTGMLDWIVTWSAEQYVFPAVASALKGVSLLGKSAVIAKTGGGGDAASVRAAKRDAKRGRWKSKGKIYKLIIDDMRVEAAWGGAGLAHPNETAANGDAGAAPRI